MDIKTQWMELKYHAGPQWGRFELCHPDGTAEDTPGRGKVGVYGSIAVTAQVSYDL